MQPFSMKSVRLRSRAAWHGVRSLSLSSYLFMAGALLIISIFAAGGVDNLRQKIIDTASPLLSVNEAAQEIVAQYIVDVKDWTHIRHENEELRAQIKELEDWKQTALMLQSENKSLKSVLNVKQDTDSTRFIAARVIADTSTSYAKSMVIDTGSDAGVKKGDGVMTANGLLGRVLEQGTMSARVLLVRDINSRIPVIVEGTDVATSINTNERAILAGRNEDTPVLERLRPDNTVASGQRVITSGLGGGFPYGLPVGVTETLPDGQIGVRLYAEADRTTHVKVVNYGLPAIGEMRSFADFSRNSDFSDNARTR